MKRFVETVVAHPKLALAAALLVAALGWRVGKGLSVDVFPEIREPRVVVQTEAGGLTAEEVEQRVTIPVEAAMNGIPGVRTVRSSSGGGLSFVWVDFDWDVDLAQARFSVFERLATVKEQLPEDVRAEIAPVVSVTGEIMLVALTCPNGRLSPLEMRELAEFDLRTRLLGVPGVGDVVVTGGRLPEFQIRVAPSVLSQYGLSFADVVSAAESSRTQASAGYLPHVAGEEIPLRQIARADTLDALKRVAIPARGDGPFLRLSDVADVSVGGAPRRGSATFNGAEAVVLAVQKTPGANTPALTRQLDVRIEQFAAEHGADGLEVHREAYRQSDFIELSIGEGRTMIRDAAIIVVIVLGLTLMRLRTILITLLTMPVSVLAGVALFPRFDLGVNVMTLGGLAVGVGDIVDCAIIFVEIVWRRLGENAALPAGERSAPARVVAAAVLEVLPSVAFSTFIIVLVFIPLLMLSGLESRFFAPLGLAYLLVFGASFLAALVLTPALGVLLWRDPRRRKAAAAPGANASAGDSPATRAMKAVYRPILALCLRFPKTLCLAMLLLFAGAVRLASGFGASFLQTFREDAFTVFVSTPPGTSLEETERIADGASAAIGRIPGVKTVLRRTGRAERDQHAEPVSASELVVRVDMGADARAIRDAIRKDLAELPGVSTMIGYPIAHRISAVLSGTEAEVAISIFGDDLAVLRDVAQKVKRILDGVPEVADVRANREILVNTYRIDYDLDALAEMGLSLKDAGEQVSAAFNGKVVGEIRDGLRVRELVVRLDGGGADLTPETVRSFVLASPAGRRQRLDEVAHVYREEASNLVIREQARRKALVTCNAAGSVDTGTLVAALRRAIEPTVAAAGCTVSYGGSFEARQSAGRRLAVLGAGLLVAIFAILTLALKTAKAAALVMLNVPLGLMGGILAVWLTSPVLSVASLIGFVTVVGFVLRNGLLLLNRYRELEEGGMPFRDAIVNGSTERMTPILMTSLTTILGLVPLVLAADKPGGELLAPLAVVQFGGLISATLLNMLVLPAVALLCGSCRPKERDGETAAPPSAARIASALAAAALLAGPAGCRAYEAAPIDWAQEEAQLRRTSAKIALATVADAERLALVANPEINAKRLKAQRGAAEAKESGWWEDPALDFDLQRIVQSSSHPFLMGSSLAFSIPLSGAPGLEAEAKRKYAEADALDVMSAEQDLCADVRAALVQWAAARRRAATLRETMEDPRIRRAEANAARLCEIGEVEEMELSAIRRRRHDRTHALRRAEQDAETARLRVCALLGVLPSADVSLPADAWPTNAAAAPVPSPGALVGHLKVRAALARLGGTEKALHAEIRRQYPDLTLGPGYSREEGQDRVGLVAGVSLPLWNRNRAGVAAAETERDVARRTALDVWRELVCNAAAAARNVRLRARHDAPEGLSPAGAERLHAAGELADVAYLALRDEILNAQLAEIDWQEDLLAARAELVRYEVKGNGKRSLK